LQILEHFAATAPVGRTHVQLLLTLIHKSKAQINLHDLPKTVESLLAVPEEVMKEVRMIPVFPTSASTNVPNLSSSQVGTPNGPQPGGQGVQKPSGHILFFGISRAVEGLSPGLDNKWRYVKDLVLIDAINPNFLIGPLKNLVERSNMNVLSVAKPVLSAETAGAGHPGSQAQNPDNVSSTNDLGSEPICVFIDLFADGFQPYHDSSKSFWLVAGLISKLGRRCGDKEEIYFTKCKLFTFKNALPLECGK
jgi:hypothetical protein